MHIISHKALVDFWTKNPLAESPLQHWYKAVKKARWTNFAELREVFGTADAVGSCVVFDVGGNKYRLIAAVHYSRLTPQKRITGGRVFVLHVLTHKNYDKGGWKEDCGCAP
jgi:mRNA interferase HigB